MHFPAVSSPLVAVEQCANCGTGLHDLYCGRCGQRRGNVRVSLGNLLREYLVDTFHLEGRLVRSIRLLLTRPGHLTREYGMGQRACSTHPVRLYLLASALFFSTYLFTRSIDQTYYGLTPDHAQSSYASSMAHGLLLFVPVLSIVLKVLYVRSGRFLVEHLVFLLHTGAAALLGSWTLLVLVTAWKLVWRSVEAAPFSIVYVFVAGVLGFGVYLTLALKAAYQETVSVTLLKGGILIACFFAGTFIVATTAARLG